MSVSAVVWIAMTIAMAAMPVAAAPAGAAAAPGSAVRPVAALNLGGDLSEGGRRLVDSNSRIILATGVAATFGAASLDGDARAYFAGRNRLGEIEKLGNEVLGTGIPGALLGAGFWAAGSWLGDLGAVRSGQSQLEAIAATGLATFVLKAGIARERPDGSDRYSMPSGHASTTFATATVINEFYGWRAGVPAFALATATGIGRMGADRHWLSDVVAGAALGIWMGRAFAIGSDESGGGAADGRDPLSTKAVWHLIPLSDGAAIALAVE